MPQYVLYFEGYYNESYLPASFYDSGIYCVYVGENQPTYNNDKAMPIYIGESQNVGKRINEHELKDTWRTSLLSGQELIYSFAKTSSEEERKGAESALIYHHQPRWNSEYKGGFTYPEKIQVTTAGKNEGLETYFELK